MTEDERAQDAIDRLSEPKGKTHLRGVRYGGGVVVSSYTLCGLKIGSKAQWKRRVTAKRLSDDPTCLKCKRQWAGMWSRQQRRHILKATRGEALD